MTNQYDNTIFAAVTELGRLLTLNKLECLALAILFTAEDPLSLDQVTEQTGFAKSSNSVILKNLEQMGLLETVAKPHSRRKYYRVVENPAGAFAMMLAQRLDNIASQQALHDLPQPDDHSVEYQNRINQLKSIYNALLLTATVLRNQRAGAWETIQDCLVAAHSANSDTHDDTVKKILS